MTSIGILGSGRVATALAAKLATAGHEVSIGTRDAGAASAKWTGPAVTFAGHAEVAREASVIINATPGDSSLERLGTLREELDGKILIDVSNATRRGPDGFPGGLLYPDGSLAEHLQQALPGTHVVKTLNTMLFSVMVDPHSLKVPRQHFCRATMPTQRRPLSCFSATSAGRRPGSRTWATSAPPRERRRSSCSCRLSSAAGGSRPSRSQWPGETPRPRFNWDSPTGVPCPCHEPCYFARSMGLGHFW